MNVTTTHGDAERPSMPKRDDEELAAVIIVGAGGHGRVVADALRAADRTVLGYVDADPALTGRQVLGLPVLGTDAALADHRRPGVWLANGIGGVGNPGSDGLRASVQSRLEAAGWRFTTVRHPSTTVSPTARVEPSAQLMAGCIVQAGAVIGRGVIVNTRAVIEHDVQVGAFSHIAPGAVVCGQVTIGARCHVGAGATVRQGLKLADEVILGLGAAAIEDCAPGVYVGVPAQRREAKP